jgi:hypothetical protein
MDSDVWNQLSRDWQRRGDTARAPERWSGDQRLRGLAPARMVEIAHQGADRARTDEVLAGLICIADRDELAARTVMQIMVPGARCLARRMSSPTESVDDRDAAVVEGLWRRICTYPWHRRAGTVAGNLSADLVGERTRARARRARFDEASLDEMLAEPTRGQFSSRSLAMACEQTPNPAQELLELLRDVVRQDRLDARSARLIGRCRVASVPAAQLAAEAGIETQSLRRQRQRAEARFAAAVAEVA